MTATSYSNQGLIEPGIGDPSTKNAWGSLLNTNDALLDSITGQTVTKSIAGTGTVQLTFTNGAADETKHAHFKFTGLLTGNRTVLWPQNVQCAFSVANNTTGAFTLTLGADDGAGSPAGTTQTVTQGSAAIFVSDGTNVMPRVSVSSGGGTVTSISTGTGLTGGPITNAGSISFAAIGAGTLWCNSGGGTAVPTPQALTTYFDNIFGNAQGNVLMRGGSAWQVLPPGTSGQILTTAGAGANPSWSNASTGATQAQMEAAAASTVYASPANLYFHPAMPKALITFFWNGGSITTGQSYNVSSIIRTGIGAFSIAVPLNFASTTTLGATFGGGVSGGKALFGGLVSISAASSPTVAFHFYNDAGVLTDPTINSTIAVYGDLA